METLVRIKAINLHLSAQDNRLLTRLRWRSRGHEGAVRQQVLQVFHDLVGAVRVVPPVLLFIPSLGMEEDNIQTLGRERAGGVKLCQRNVVQRSSKVLKTVFGLEFFFFYSRKTNCCRSVHVRFLCTNCIVYLCLCWCECWL